MLSQTDDVCGFTADAVLADVAAARVGQLELAATVLQAAAIWADLHPGLDPDWIAFASSRGDGCEVPLAGDGTPTVDSQCIAELGAVLGQSTDSAQLLIGDALELRHRLPLLWARVMELRIPAWEARRAAQLTKHLTREAATFVDGQLQILPRLSAGRVERLVDAAIARYMPDLAEAERLRAAEARRVDLDPCQGSGPLDGLASISGVLDLADAIDLDSALTARAAELGRLGVDGSVQVRRSIALGDLARADQQTLHLDPTEGSSTVPGPDESFPEGSVPGESFPEGSAPDESFPEPFDRLRTGFVEGPGAAAAEGASNGPAPERRVPGRQIVFYVHLSEAALTGASEVAWLDRNTGGRLDLVDRPLLTGQVRAWCAAPDARIIIKPVIDLNQTVSAPGYRVPDRIIERLRLRDNFCVFPWCRNRRTDADHINSYDHDHPERGAQTSTDDLALLCRRHHRLKTFTRSRYRIIRAGCYLWTSPYGRRYLRDEHGTYPLE